VLSAVSIQDLRSYFSQLCGRGRTARAAWTVMASTMGGAAAPQDKVNSKSVQIIAIIRGTTDRIEDLPAGPLRP